MNNIFLVSKICTEGVFGEQWGEIKVDQANTAWLSDITLFVSLSVEQTVNLKNSIFLEHGSVIDLDVYIF